MCQKFPHFPASHAILFGRADTGRIDLRLALLGAGLSSGEARLPLVCLPEIGRGLPRNCSQMRKIFHPSEPTATLIMLAGAWPWPRPANRGWSPASR